MLTAIVDYGARCRALEAQLAAWIELAKGWLDLDAPNGPDAAKAPDIPGAMNAPHAPGLCPDAPDMPGAPQPARDAG